MTLFEPITRRYPGLHILRARVCAHWPAPFDTKIDKSGQFSIQDATFLLSLTPMPLRGSIACKDSMSLYKQATPTGVKQKQSTKPVNPKATRFKIF